LPRDEPIVVFARFTDEIDRILKAFKTAGRTFGEVTGRRKDLDSWYDGKINSLAVQIQAGGVGIDLTRARYAVYWSTGFSLGDYEQSLARVHRPGQTRSVNYIHLIAKGTIDEKIYGALKSRANLVESVLANLGKKLTDSEISEIFDEQELPF